MAYITDKLTDIRRELIEIQNELNSLSGAFYHTGKPEARERASLSLFYATERIRGLANQIDRLRAELKQEEEIV